MVWGNANWTGIADLSASFHVGWDNNYLYVAVKVHDDKYVQNASGADLYKGDGIEFMFDRQLQADYYTRVSARMTFSWVFPPVDRTRAGPRKPTCGFRVISPGRGPGSRSVRCWIRVYRVEAAIPWSVLETTPVNGGHYGFAIAIDDNDNANENLQQTMASNVLGYLLANPTTWGDLQLVK